MLQTKQHIGRLDERITFQKKITTTNDSNEDAEIGWSNYTTTWAQVIEKSGSEFYRSDQLTGVKVAEFTIRYRMDITEQMRINRGGEIYNITAVIRISRKGYLKIMGETGNVIYNDIQS